MNPVEIWEGIDTGEETGRNRLTKIAIHILSIVANSAGCERAFSHMGLVHTGIRSKLGVEKVRKATVVGMDIKQTHVTAGLLRARGKRRFTSEGDVESALGNIGSEDPLDFDQLSERLIGGAASANGDKDVGDADDDEPVPIVTAPAPPIRLTITIPPLTSATHSAQPTPVKVSIPLRTLFKYPINGEPPSDGMNAFWKGGIQNLEKELEAYDLLSGSGEENSTDLEINSEISTVGM